MMSNDMRRCGVWALMGLFIAGVSIAADQLAYGPAPVWAKPAVVPAEPAGASQAAIQLMLQDFQLKFSSEGEELYTRAVARIQTPQGLAALGTLTLPWKPESDVLTVHTLHILRGEEVIDVLSGGQSFTILRRENNLEYAALDGVLSATIQPAGLQVGDVIDMAYTLKRSDPVLAGTAQEVLGGWQELPVAHIRVRAQWPTAMAVHWKGSKVLGTLKETRSGGTTEVSLALDHIEPLAEPEGAPPRYAILRQLEFSGFKSWGEVSARLAPLYVKAATLTADSPLQKEIAKIRKQTADPVARAEQALALVQDQVRYVYLGMNDGALVPAAADITWVRRFGDCKAKTTLLLALLRELDIQAEPVAVSTVLGDGLDERLPMVGVFNHVLVRAEVGGQSYWLDGTRSGDRHLPILVTPNYRWGLPLAAPGAELVQIVAQPLKQPLAITTIHIDATAGIHAPAPFHAEIALGGDVGTALRLQLANLTATDLDRALRINWTKRYSFVDATSVSATFDEQTGYEKLTLDGTAHMDWGRDRYETDGLGVGYYAEFKREAGAQHDAPFAVRFPTFSRVKETILLPHDGAQFTIEGEDVNQTVAGVEYQRHARLGKGVFEVDASIRSVASEFPFAEAESAQKTLREMATNTLYVRAPEHYLATARDAAAALTKTPETSDGFVTRGNMMLDRENYPNAIADFDKAIAIDIKNDMAWADRGIAHVWLHEDELAREDFSKAFALNPRNAVIYRGRGWMALNAKQYAEAVAALTTALEIEPKNRFALERRAQAYALSGEEEKALADYAEVIRLQPGALSAYKAKAEILLRLDRFEEVNALADALLAANGESAEARSMADSLHDRSRRLGDPIDDALHAQAMDPSPSASDADAEYAIHLVTAEPVAGTPLVAGSSVDFKLNVTYSLKSAKRGFIVLVFQDDKNRAATPGGTQVSQVVNGPSGTATLTDKVTVPTDAEELRLFVPLTPEGVRETSGEVYLRYPIRKK